MPHALPRSPIGFRAESLVPRCSEALTNAANMAMSRAKVITAAMLAPLRRRQAIAEAVIAIAYCLKVTTADVIAVLHRAEAIAAAVIAATHGRGAIAAVVIASPRCGEGAAKTVTPSGSQSRGLFDCRLSARARLRIENALADVCAKAIPELVGFGDA